MDGVPSLPPAAIRTPCERRSRANRPHNNVRSCRRESAPGARLHRHAQRYGWARNLVQDTLKKDPFSGNLFAFRGKKASILKVLFLDGNGLCLFTKRIDQGGFVWPVMAGYNGAITLTPAQLAMLLEGN
ncbi:IS66 family insertion sequence element accessory protein TnpB [Bradyrhizobium sp. HKCCYLS20291]|uniref:IS66 family insertion sequence element accessory protein TnpB n=1 Tax=Bradyrhizobium sp. HKCCYLS20291 TaxID=3420766 RepID=UPI003EBC674B